jgi:hypothetical protein
MSHNAKQALNKLNFDILTNHKNVFNHVYIYCFKSIRIPIQRKIHANDLGKTAPLQR